MKTLGQIEYEADLARSPNYPDGEPRPTWENLSELARWSWDKPRTIPLKHLLDEELSSQSITEGEAND